MEKVEKQDIILAGVGGQGILSIAFVIDNAALKEGWNLKQSEVHGMAQRGGAVQSHLRLSRGMIWSDLIPKGSADIILAVEPLEALRYLEYLSAEGIVISSSNPYVNIPDYPDKEKLLEKIRGLGKGVLVDSEKLAREAGSWRTQNMVMLGVASRVLVLRKDSLREFVKVLFAPKGERVVETNLRAFDLGRSAV